MTVNVVFIGGTGRQNTCVKFDVKFDAKFDMKFDMKLYNYFADCVRSLGSFLGLNAIVSPHTYQHDQINILYAVSS